MKAKQAKPKPKTTKPKPKQAQRLQLGIDKFELGPLAVGGVKLDTRNNKRTYALGSNQNIDLRKSNYIEQDELIQPVNGSTDFVCSAFSIQPGDETTYPWLGRIAALYERYKFEYMNVYYKPIVSGYASQGQAGKVILSVDYDSIADTPDSYRVAESMDPHADGLPSEIVVLTLDKKRLTPTDSGKFIRQGAVPGGADPKTYDAGALYFSRYGELGTGPVGELRVSYGVHLFNPRLPDQVGVLPKNFNLSQWNEPTGQLITSGVEAKVLYPSQANTALGGLAVTNNAGVFNAPPGRYIVAWEIRLVASAGNVITDALASGSPAPAVANFNNAYVSQTISGGLQVVMLQGTTGWNNSLAPVPPIDYENFQVIVKASFAAGTVTVYGSILFHAV